MERQEDSKTTLEVDLDLRFLTGQEYLLQTYLSPYLVQFITPTLFLT
jgi:hypothetical protein